MDSPQLFLAFGAVMLIAALLGVAIDWFGKPLRHRKFVPKAYRYPDERQPRRSKVRATDWSDASFVLPVTESPAQLMTGAAHRPSAASALDAAPAERYPRDVGPPTAQVPVIFDDPDLYDPPAADDAPRDGAEPDVDDLDLSPQGIVTLEDANPDDPDLLDDPGGPDTADQADAADAPAAADPPDLRTRGWKPGDYVFNLTPDGREPSATTVRNRYWKNVADTGGAGIFGATNLERMGAGKPPKRRNHRTGKAETMRLPAADHDGTSGETPVPEWGSPELDPFA